MPQLYNNAVITDAGLALLDKVQAGTASIQFTRMATGDGTYTANEKTSSALKRCTRLKVQRDSYPLSSVSTVPDGGVKLTVLITNQDPATGATLVSEGYHINEIGLFAKERGGADSTEVLYSITVARGDTGDYMPPYEDGAPVQIVQGYHAKVGNATEVAISCTGAVMLVEDARREFEKLQRMINEVGAIGDKTLTFERARERDNIASGETMDVIMGKIEKNLADLKDIAFTANYNDLTDKPDIPSIPSSLPASDVTSTYSSTGTAPVNGKAVNEALGTLDVSTKGGAGRYIQSISETDGKISAIEATMPDIPSAPADIGAVSAEELAVKKFVVPNQVEDSTFKSISHWSVTARRSGNVVGLDIQVSGEMFMSSIAHTLFTLPEEYRPKDNVNHTYILRSGGAMFLQVGKNGLVSINNMNKQVSGGLCEQDITYIVD